VKLRRYNMRFLPSETSLVSKTIERKVLADVSSLVVDRHCGNCHLINKSAVGYSSCCGTVNMRESSVAMSS
jgi:hypothetical protein